MESSPASSPQLSVVQFAPLESSVESTFWYELANNKLEKYRLNEAPAPIQGFVASARHAEVGCPLQLTVDSFCTVTDAVPGSDDPAALLAASAAITVPGTLINVNTLDTFKQLERPALLHQAGAAIWEDIVSGAAAENPNLLSRFLLITFADLKRFAFYYWFAFPALMLPVPARGTPLQPLVRARGEAMAASLAAACEAFDRERADRPLAWLLSVHGAEVAAHPLSQWDSLQSEQEVILAFRDPCHLEGHPGWPLRNLLLLAATRWGAQHLKEHEFQAIEIDHDTTQHLYLEVTLETDVTLQSSMPKLVGWETNARGKPGPRVVDLGPSMDPIKLAHQAVDLNLKLMKWRMLPALDTDKLANTKCLLLGAGTLGCAVARTLLGWGFKHITFLDSGNVSFSNPVRQSLFEYADCLNGGRPKAEAAAERLKAIFPGVNAEGVQLSIPMPGHAVGPTETANVIRDVERLSNLIASHDLVFLLTDTRESRWLPSMLCAHMNKMTMNTALGFDGYLVMRHGVSTSQAGEGSPEAPHLGCYFCNDVVAPQNSLKDRTLDQQCTVTRPGLAFIASALAVELAVALLHHPEGAAAEAGTAADTAEECSPLGLLPHQIRGFLVQFQQVLFHGPSFKQCTACSPTVTQKFAQEGNEFILKVCNEPAYLEDLTELSQMHQQTMDATADWDDDDAEDDF